MRGLFLVLLWIGCIPLAQGAPDPAQTEQQLQRINTQLQHIVEQIKKDQRDYADEEKALQHIEQTIGESARVLQQFDRSISQQDDRLMRLKVAQKKEQQAFQQHHRAWLYQIRQAYQYSHQDRLKMILNQENPAALNRFLEYYQYLHRARTQTLDAISQALQQLQQTAQQIEQHREEQSALKNKRQTQYAAMEDQLKERRGVLSNLKTKIAHGEAALIKLKQNKQTLEKLLQELAKVQHNYAWLNKRSFSHTQGKLAWPVHGKLLQHFGSTLEGSLKANGVLLSAEPGTPVRVIHTGKVVFANWLRGFGLLLIVDHGSGYWSLYARNQSLLAQAGHMVQAGEVIALAGNTGGFEKPALYFEIRERGKPVNPEKWCH